MRSLSLILLLNCFVYSIQAQETKSYTFDIEQAITFALDSNYTAINARRDIAKALKQKWETTASGLPQISGNVAYQNNLILPVTPLPAEIAGGEPGTFVPVVFSPQQSINAFATLNQLIFDGSYLVGLQAAEAFLDFSENAAEKTNLEVRKGVINAYGSVLLSEELITIFESNKSNVEKNLFETRKIYENGLTEEENVEQLEITLLDIDTQLNNAKRSVSIAKQMFNIALGIPVESKVTFTTQLDDLALKNIALDLLETELPVEENIDYKIAYNLTQQRSLEMKLEQSKALPSLTGFINYGANSFNDNFTFFNGNQPWFESSAIGLNLSIPLFSSGMRNAKTQRAKIAVEQAQTQLKETIQNVKLQLDTAQSNYQFAIEKYNNAKKNIALSERIENKNQIKFKEGLSTSFDLRQAQLQLYTAQQQYIQSMFDLVREKAEIETILNTPDVRVSIEEIKNKY